MTLSFIRKSYGVPARRGGRVEYTGNGKPELGTITGASGAHLRIRLDGLQQSSPFHPTWKLRYLPEERLPARKILTPSMRKVLENLVAGRKATCGFPGGRSVSRGLSGTFVALHRRGFLTPGTGEVTEAGRHALEGRS